MAAHGSRLLVLLLLLSLLACTVSAQVDETMFEFTRNWNQGATEESWEVDDLLDLLGGEWNLPPYVISIPPESVRLGKEYVYHMEVADPEGDGVVYEFLQAPNGMTIGPTGEVRWTPAEVSPATVEVRISDPVNSITEAWGIRVEEWNTGVSVAVDAVVGGTAEVTDTSSELYGTQIQFPPGALPEDATVTISAATIGIDFYDAARMAYIDGLPPVTGAVQIRVPVSNDLLASVTSAEELALFVHDAVSGEWLMIENVVFTPASAKDRARDKNLGGHIVGAIGNALEGAAEVTIDIVAAFGRTLIRVGEGIGSFAKRAFELANDIWFQSEKFVRYQGSLWGSGKTLFVIHGCLGDPGDFDDAGDVAWSFRNDYDNIYFWQYKSARPIGSRPKLLERIPWQRSGKNLWKQFSDHYVSKSLNQLAPKGYRGGSTVNEGIPLPNLKALKWNFRCDTIVHSMGGLVARECLENQSAFRRGVYVDGFVDNLVTLGTPHNGGLKQHVDSWYGTALRTIARLRLNVATNVLFDAIEFTMPGAIDLVDGFYPNLIYFLAKDFVDHLNADRPANLHTRYWQIAGNQGDGHDGWVTLDSALHGADEATKIINGKNHTQLHTEFHTNGAEPWVRQRLGLSGGPTGETIIINIPNLPIGARQMKLVRIPAGTFQMGSPDTERSRQSTEGPVHTVTIGYDFYMGETEVTQAQWKAIMGSNPARTSGVGNDYPMYFVSWNDITHPNGFLHQLDAQTSYSGFRLPTESEWEYACRAGTQTRFYFGDSLGCGDLSQNCAAGVLPGTRADYMWYDWSDGRNGYPRGSKEVGSLTANQFGLFNMHGNVLEWCEDYWHGNYIGAPTDGSAWNSPTSSARVIRGGDWDFHAWYCRSAGWRHGYSPAYRGTTTGFRVVLPVSS